MMEAQSSSQTHGRREDDFGFGLLILRCLQSLDQWSLEGHRQFSSATWEGDHGQLVILDIDANFKVSLLDFAKDNDFYNI